MRKISTLSTKTDFIIKKSEDFTKLEPKQSTINFLLAYSNSLYTEKLKDGKMLKMTLN